MTEILPLARASTLTSRYYLEPAILAAEKERVFGRTWQLVAHWGDLARPGDFVPVTVLDEPVVLVHGTDGILRAFFNVCRHRAGQVALTRGNRRSLQCRYHGWTYGLDGTLRTAPEMEQTEDFDMACFGLQPVRVDRWGPFVFVNLDDSAPDLADVLGAIPAEVAAAGFDLASMGRVERRDYIVECNWKVYVDNYLEGYHIPIAHPALFREIDYDDYRIETQRYYSKQHAPVRELKPGQELGRDRRYMRASDGEEDALYYWLFPNTMFNIYPDNMSTNVILPLGTRAHADHLRVVLRRARERAAAGNRCSRRSRSRTRSSRRTSSSASRSSAACARVPTTPAASAPSERTASTTSSRWCASSSPTDLAYAPDGRSPSSSPTPQQITNSPAAASHRPGARSGKPSCAWLKKLASWMSRPATPSPVSAR